LDKTLLSRDKSIGGAVFACKGIFCIEKQGLVMRLGKEGGVAAHFSEISSPYGRVTRQEGIFEHNSGRPLLHASFSRCFMIDVFIPGVIAYSADSAT
jgi:hypothetical protein